MDWSALGFLVLAIGAILAGSFLGTEAERHRAFGAPPDSAAAAAAAAASPGETEPPQELTTRKILMFVGFASTFLVIMYFLFDVRRPTPPPPRRQLAALRVPPKNRRVILPQYTALPTPPLKFRSPPVPSRRHARPNPSASIPFFARSTWSTS